MALICGCYGSKENKGSISTCRSQDAEDSQEFPPGGEKGKGGIHADRRGWTIPRNARTVCGWNSAA